MGGTESILRIQTKKSRTLVDSFHPSLHNSSHGETNRHSRPCADVYDG